MAKRSSDQHMAVPPKRTALARALISKLEKQVDMEKAEARLLFETIASAISDYLADIDWGKYQKYEEAVASCQLGEASKLYNDNRRVIFAVRLYRDARNFFVSNRFKFFAGMIGLDWEYIHRVVLSGEEYQDEVAA